MNAFFHLFAVAFLSTMAVSCDAQDAEPSVESTPPAKTPEEIQAEADAHRIAEFTDPVMADGFDFPVGDVDGGGSYKAPGGKRYRGWYLATKFLEKYSYGIHTGEDWNGNGGGDTDLGQPVRTIGAGRVLYAAEPEGPFGNIVLIEHVFLENGRVTRVFSQYDHLREMKVAKDEVVKRGQIIGSIGKGKDDCFLAHLHLEIRKESMVGFVPEFWPSSHGWDEEKVRANYESPTLFIKAHRKLLKPASTPKLLWVVKSRCRSYWLEKGKITHIWECALSQDPEGAKTAEGDLKTPEGEYHVLDKVRGPFDGPEWMKFLGEAWIRLDYPNLHDAAAGLAAESITPEQHGQILTAHRKRKMPLQKTDLGGGIGIHGWSEEGWKPEGSRSLTWGCVSLNKEDLLKLYSLVSNGMPVVITP